VWCLAGSTLRREAGGPECEGEDWVVGVGVGGWGWVGVWVVVGVGVAVQARQEVRPMPTSETPSIRSTQRGSGEGVVQNVKVMRGWRCRRDNWCAPSLQARPPSSAELREVRGRRRTHKGLHCLCLINRR